jgi:Peptidase M50B-like
MTGLWDGIAGLQFDPPSRLVLLTGLFGLSVVAVDRVWWQARNVITLVHEAGHALAALLTGRRLTGIRLHSDTSGVTLSVGKPEGVGMVVTVAAGYLSPSLLGLCGVAVLARGWVTVALWVIAALLLAMLVMIRNVYGMLSVLLTGAVVVLVSWYASAQVQAAFSYAATWFLLIGGVRAAGELYRGRRSRGAGSSDAGQLAQLTGVPALLWILLFAVASLTALAAGAWLLLH